VGSDGRPLPRVDVSLWKVHADSAFKTLRGLGYADASGRTDQEGRVVFEDLPRGQFDLVSSGPRTTEAGPLSVPCAEPVYVRLPLRRCALRVVGPGGRPARDASVHVSVADGWRMEFERTDHAGVSWIPVYEADEGAVTLRVISRDGLLWNRDTAFVPPPTDTPHVVVLEPRPRTAELTVVVECEDANARLPYVVTLEEIESGARILRAVGGASLGRDVYAGLPPGRHRVRVHRPNDGVGYGRWPLHVLAQEVELTAFETMHVRFPLPCGGLVHAEVRAEGLGPDAEVCLVFRPAAEEERKFVDWMRDGDRRELTAAFRVPPGVGRVLHSPLEPGHKVVFVSAPGFRERVVPIEIRAAETATLRVRLDPE
jgi:hypothetical protein